MAGVFDLPMAPNRSGEVFHSQWQTADEVTHVDRFVSPCSLREMAMPIVFNFLNRTTLLSSFGSGN
jgi:hypothetical protein